jgi:hypothetical protein
VTEQTLIWISPQKGMEWLTQVGPESYYSTQIEMGPHRNGNSAQPKWAIGHMINQSHEQEPISASSGPLPHLKLINARPLAGLPQTELGHY